MALCERNYLKEISCRKLTKPANLSFQISNDV